MSCDCTCSFAIYHLLKKIVQSLRFLSCKGSCALILLFYCKNDVSNSSSVIAQSHGYIKGFGSGKYNFLYRGWDILCQLILTASYSNYKLFVCILTQPVRATTYFSHSSCFFLPCDVNVVHYGL